jgi:hypothetical protein
MQQMDAEPTQVRIHLLREPITDGPYTGLTGTSKILAMPFTQVLDSG